MEKQTQYSTLSNEEFEILVFLDQHKEKTIEELAKEFKTPKDVLEQQIQKLRDKKLISETQQKMMINKKGYQALEPYRVKKAIILAAGKGTRMRPITQTIPKPMVKVNDKRIIETLLDALKSAEITDVTIVRGYLSEKFDELLPKYPYLKFVENEDYDTTNNMSSALRVKDELKNAYIMEADLDLYNPDLIRKYEYCSNYVGKYVTHTDDWCFKTDNKRITDVVKGGNDCYHMYGIAYFSKEAGEKIGSDISQVYYHIPGGKDRFWDDVHLSIYNQKYNFQVRECQEGDIIEIDTFDELKKIDHSYQNYQIDKPFLR